ncbi:bifunctional UDP-sugar hydrolase/5'-nucleotidase [Bacteriovoracaceae bacterium]|nr:bifunctional UDP-sugar hydrolase/5'-nucleotidase [Bacteriovoracaceae bacterium]
MREILILLSLLLCLSIQAERLQILHTNDLHGFFDHSVANPRLGGYARVKAIIDEYKAQAASEGIETLVVDAGDFMEGNLYYMANKGAKTFNIMSTMGYDAVVVGNHDFLMGTKKLNTLLKDNPPKFSYLAANFQLDKTAFYSGIRKSIKPYTMFEKAGVKIALMGLTTDELFYAWAFKHGKIKKPGKVADKLVEEIRKKENPDFVFALTHLGTIKDEKMLKNSKGIDLVVGGHSHTAMFRPAYFPNKDNVKVPVVQAGSHGKFLGRLILDLEKGKPVKIVKYELIPIHKAHTEEDEVVADFVRRSREIINETYGEEWLKEVVGHTDIPLIHSGWRMTPWTAWITDAVREAVDADISFHSPNFGGANLPVGDITREDLFNTHPRSFDHKNKLGWSIYSVNIYGVVLKSVIRLVLKTQQPLAFSGITFDLVDKKNNIVYSNGQWIGNGDGEVDEDVFNKYLGIDGKFRVKNIKVNGKKISSYRKYRVALNEGIVVGGLGISSVAKLLLRKISKSEITVWSALINKMSREKNITREYGQSKPNYIEGNQKGLKDFKGPYQFIPYTMKERETYNVCR